MTDRPASWRIPTPKQMEKMAAAAAVSENAPSVPTPGPGDEMPPEYWQAVMDDPLANKSRTAAAPPFSPAAAGGNSSTYSEGVVPPMCQDPGNPEGRCCPPLLTDGGLEGRRSAPIGQYLPTAHRSARRRRVLAALRLIAGAAGPQTYASWMPGWRRNTTPRPLRRRPQGPEQGAHQGA
jgi:hypothetical protein